MTNLLVSSRKLKCSAGIRRFSTRIRKDKAFYESEGKEHRRYFYVIDHRGLLFLEEAKFRNYATCLKDKTFLDFFFKQLRPNNTEYYHEIPFVSPCGKELNYLTVDDPIAPVVFGDLLTVNEGQRLSLGFSNLQQSFEPSSIRLDPETGRLYHPVLGHKHLSNHMGLMNQAITDILSSGIKSHVFDGSIQSSLKWKGKEYVIPSIHMPD